MRHGSCNAYEFIVQRGFLSRTGNNTSPRDDWANVGLGLNSGTLSDSMVKQQQSEPLIWQYNNPEIFPTVYVLTTNGANPTLVWESESRPEPGNPKKDPMIIHDPRDVELLTGGVQTEVFLPTQSDLESFESTVTAASLPSWISGTKWKNVADSEVLLKGLFESMQREVGQRGKIYQTISSALNRFHQSTTRNLYKLLWLRAASMIVQDHQGKTAIPLFLNNITIDTSSTPATVTLA